MTLILELPRIRHVWSKYQVPQPTSSSPGGNMPAIVRHMQRFIPGWWLFNILRLQLWLYAMRNLSLTQWWPYFCTRLYYINFILIYMLCWLLNLSAPTTFAQVDKLCVSILRPAAASLVSALTVTSVCLQLQSHLTLDYFKASAATEHTTQWL